jgi:hypothetical protein
MSFNSFKLNFSEFQQLKYAKYTVHCVFAMVTQWLGEINRFLTIWQISVVFLFSSPRPFANYFVLNISRRYSIVYWSSFMFLKIQILAKMSTFMLTAFCYQEAENMKWGEGYKQIQVSNPGCKMWSFCCLKLGDNKHEGGWVAGAVKEKPRYQMRSFPYPRKEMDAFRSRIKCPCA